MKKPHLCLMTGADNRSCYLVTTIRLCAHHHASVHLVDTGSTDDTALLSRQFDINYIRMEDWQDNWPLAYMTAIRDVPEGEWFLFFDSDERPGPALLEYLPEVLADLEQRGLSRGQISGVLHMNGTCENCPPGQVEHYLASWPQTDEEYRLSPIWTKTIILRKTRDLTALANGPHCMFWHETTPETRYYPWGYNHYKTSSQLDASIAICSFPGLHHYGVPPDAPEWVSLEELKARYGLFTTRDFTQAIRHGTLPAEFDRLFDSWQDASFETCKHYYRFARQHHYHIDLSARPCGDICCRYIGKDGEVIQV